MAPAASASLLVLGAALLLAPARGELEGAGVAADWNIVHETAAVLARGNGSLDSPCVMEPAEFRRDVDFYVVECKHTAKTVELNLKGGNLYLDRAPLNGGTLLVSLEAAARGHMRVVQSCPGVTQPGSEGDWEQCVPYTFDVYRVAGSYASLLTLAVNGKSPLGSGLMTLSPDFDPGVFEYTAVALLGEPFEILAASREEQSSVGIAHGKHTFGAHASCEEEAQENDEKEDARHRNWHLDGPKATGQYRYTVCAIAPDGLGATEYTLNVQVRKLYSAELSSVEIVGLGDVVALSPAFSSGVQSYVVLLPDEKPRIREVPLRVKTQDPQAAIAVQCNNELVLPIGIAAEETARGEASVNVTMANNDLRIRLGRPPEWNSVHLFRVTSADGEYTRNYQITVQQQVSNFSLLSDISVGPCMLSPPFDPKVTEYECVWNYDSGHDSVDVTPVIDAECSDCEIQMPSPRNGANEDELSLDVEAMPKQPWSAGRAWSRKFIFGERHVLPITVVSEDRFTHTTYRVTLEYWAPWYMKASFSRAVSTASSTLAGVMAISSAGNVLALAKQVQFMALTTKIDGVPPTYADFANNLRHFNLDFGAWLPLDFLPSEAEFIRKKDELVSYVQTEVAEAGLLLEYCFATRHHSRLMANAILFESNRTAELLEWLEEQNETGDSRRLSERLGGLPHASELAGRRLDDWAEELDLDDDDDDDETAGVWAWMDADWENLQAEAEAAGVTEDQYPLLPCHYPTVGDSLVFLDIFHEAYEMKNMMESMTGSFLLVVIGGLTLGGLYYAYYRCFIKRNQCRLHMLEPGIVAFFVLDFALISFSGGASRLMFTQDVVTFFVWRPSYMEVKLFCAAGLLLYPVFFIVYATWCVYRLTVPREGEEPLLVWNTSFLKSRWSDMRCPDLKVAVRSRLRKVVPFMPRIFVTYIRHCVPVLNSEGEPFIAADTDISGHTLKRQAVLSLEEQLRQQEELALLDKKEEEELSSAHNQRVQKFRAGRLLKQRARAAQVQDRARDHHKTLDAQVEKARDDAMLDGADRAAPWLPRGHRSYCNIPLAALTDTWKSQKNRPGTDRLDNEEQYAMKQYITQAIEDEQRLLRYNILQVAPQDGWLKPKEPVKGDSGKWWLDSADDYEAEDHGMDFGHHPELEEYEKGLDYVEDDFGKRLVYRGRESSWACLRFLSWMRPAVAKLEWMDEPKEGWPEWEAKTLRSKTNPASNVRYADKWQWICLEHWTQPWHVDEDRDTDWHLFRWGEARYLKFKPAYALGFKVWAQLRKERLRLWKQYVPFQIAPRDKIEIRKWVYGQLMRYMDMKLKLCYLADHHPKFYKTRSLEDMAKMSFRDVVFGIETAKPNQERLIEGERHLHPHELMEYTIMRFEDLYDYNDEPWWKGCDQPESEEVKVMFDHAKFWRSGDDPEAEELQQNELIPPNGYSTSSYLNEDAEVGVKRYRLWKPDGASVDVKTSLELKHVLPLMRYTRQFKMNVDSENLDLPYQTNYSIIIGDKKNGEQYNFTVERFCLLLAIVVLSAESVTHQGLLCAWVFFAAKFTSLVSALAASVVAQRRERLREGSDLDSAEVRLVSVDGVEGSSEGGSTRRSLESSRRTARTLLESAGSNAPFSARSGQSGKPASNTSERVALLDNNEPEDIEAGANVTRHSKNAKEPAEQLGSLTILLTALTEGDILVLASQCVLLWFLICTLQFELPPEIAGFVCIVIATFAMLCLGVISSFQEIRELIEEHADDIEVFKAKVMAWLNSRNDPTEALRAQQTSRVNVLIPELGIVFSGETQDAEEASHEDALARLTKKVAYHVNHRAARSSSCPSSVRELPRFEADIRNSLSVALDVDQMMLCKKIPQIVATLQCVNHVGTSDCCAKNDTYLTLFKPEDWEPEFDKDTKKKEDMLLGWQAEVHDWMRDTLGAVDLARTCAKEIQEEIAFNLRKDIMGSRHRTRLKVKVNSLEVPREGLDGKLAYVTVVDETESVIPTRDERGSLKFPTDRTSGYARLHGAPARCEFEVDLGAEIDVPVPAYKAKVRLCVWAQVNDGVDELVGYTGEIDLSEHIQSGDDDDLLDGDAAGAPTSGAVFPLHTRWTYRRGKDSKGVLVPLCEEEGVESQTGAQEMLRSSSSFLAPICRVLAPMRRVAARVAALWEMTEEQKRATLGALCIEVRQPDAEEDEEDVRLMMAVQEVMAGSDSLNLAKLEQHKDCWPDLARVFGVRVGEAQRALLEDHLKSMRVVGREASGAGMSLEQRRKVLLARGVRAQLADPRKMDEAEQRLAGGIQRISDRLGREKDHGIFPVPPYELLRRRVAGAKDLELEEHEPDRAFANCLLNEMWRHRKSQADSRQQILHYVMLSDHLKPNKNWRPDPINTHSAAIVNNEFDDVAEVVLRGDMLPEDGSLKFLQETQSSGIGPLCINGRLCFKAVQGIFPGCQDAFMYWDGRRRWVISPFRGEPVPYGSRSSHASKFMWVKDPAVSPDLIQAHWHRWPTEDQVRRAETAQSGPRSKCVKVSSWEADPSLRVRRTDRSFAFTRASSRHQSFKEDAEPKGIANMLRTVMTEVAGLFAPQSRRRLDPELKDCLIGLSATQLTISWKDVQIERLAPFRRFLLEEFGSYQSAWAFITRKVAINRSLAARNLTSMFEAAYISIVNPEDDSKGLQRLSSSISALPQLRQPRRVVTAAAAKSLRCISSGKLSRGASVASSDEAGRELLLNFLEREDYDSLRHLADTIISRLDADSTGDITAEELSALYEDDLYDDDLLLDFKAWLRNHKAYQSFENMWAELSDGVGVDIATFSAAIERLTFKLGAYEGMTRQRWSPEEKAKSLFRDLDAQMDGKISLNEIIPSTGPRWENVQDSMLKFNIPLGIIQDVQTEGHRRLVHEQSPCLRIQVKPQFELSPEWQALKLALDPDWQPRRNFESVEISLAPADFALWRQVIMESAMLHPQEWVRFYDGAYKEHPRINGIYMRHGVGTQRWADGRVYAGQWRNHIYHGHGQIFETILDWKESHSPPLYTGEFAHGKRHGEGVMRFEQELEDRRGQVALTRGKQKGIAKVYEGSFRDDLFHGQGVLYMAKAVPQQVPGQRGKAARQGLVPPPQLQPSQLLRFEGLFASSYQETFDWVHGRDSLFSKAYPQGTDGQVMRSRDGTVMKDLALETVTRRDRAIGSDRFLKYFDTDSHRVQKAGMPMPDLAHAAYRMKGGDTMHIRRGQARYADGTEYEGEFQGGRPHGQGRMAQWEVLPDGQFGKCLATYEGGWESGEFSGRGKYETCYGLVYEGGYAKNKRSGEGSLTVPEHLQEAWGYSSYIGQWEDNRRHGFGEMTFSQGRYLYKGHFEKNARVGSGRIYKVGEKEHIMLYNGQFKDDMVFTSPEAPMWWRIVESGQTRGTFYYGAMTEEGAREGVGTLFGEDADKDPSFMACFEQGRAYDKEDPADFATLRYLIYQGQWKNNLPHGQGTQHFCKGSTSDSAYVGHFAKGKRHGRGTWTKKDGSWTYRPIPDKPALPNWDNDLMHGIGIVEDTKTVHENVIYKKGKCQMPFTQTGPPVTGFEQTAGLGLAVKGARRLVTRGGRGSGPGSSLALQELKGASSIFRKRSLVSVSSEGGGSAKVGSSPSLARGNSRLAITKGTGDREEQLQAEDEELALVREPTDLSAPEEDVALSGGTGENEVMNGLYFKLSGCFGHSIYRLVRRSGFPGEATERYLYKQGPFWIVSPEPFGTLAELRTGPGTAYVEDPEAEVPRAISRPWYVWHPPSKAMRRAEEDEFGIADRGPSASWPAPADRPGIRSVLGFDLAGGCEAVSQGLLLRHGSELYGRPVYESEDGMQFLYWLREGGSLRDGVDNELYAAGESRNAQALYEAWFGSRGHWVISKEIGAPPKSRACMAFIADTAATPDQLGGDAGWCVRASPPVGSPAARDSHVGKFSEDRRLTLTLQEWVRDLESGGISP